MNDHDWTRDYVATYLANGLEAEDRSRLETHIASCATCAAVLDETRAFDVSLNEIFAPVRPDPLLEDRVIRGLRTRPTMSPLRRFWIRVGVGVAAVVTVGALGAVVSSELEEPTRSAIAMTARAGIERPRPHAYAPRPANLPMSDMVAAAPGRPVADAASRKGDFGGGWSGGADKDSAQALGRAGEDSNESSDFHEMEKAKSLERFDGRKAGGEAEESFSYSDQLKGESLEGAAKQNQYFRPEAAPPPAGAPAPMDKANKADLKSRDRADSGPGEARARAKAPGSPAADPARSGSATGQGAQDPPAMQSRKIIRNGDMEFEIENFDTCVATVMKIVAEERGYIATVNSEKLENGKVRGEIVLRCPPDNLDNLVLKLRGIGDLKGQKITSEDVTKTFYDTESRLRAARQMETRLLEIIKSGKGEIKDLLEAEKQLGEWRQKIEVMEGELRYLTSMVSLCTLKVKLLEKNIRTASSSTETENVSAGIEAEDVEKQYQAALAAVAELKGRVTGSEMKRYEAGQYHARVTCEVSPDNSGALRDRLKQLGNVARLDVDRQVTTDGTGTPTGPIKKNDSRFDISIYNIINIAPRKTWQANIACVEAEKTYEALLAKLKDDKSGARVVASNLNVQRGDKTSGFINFEVKADQAAAILDQIGKSGDILRMTSIDNADVRNSTGAKVGIQVGIYAYGAIRPRETTDVFLAAKDVSGGYKALQAEVAKLKGRVVVARLDESKPQDLRAVVDCEIRRDDETAFALAMKGVGEIYSRTSERLQDTDNTIDSKIKFKLTLVDAGRIPPKKTWSISLESSDIEKATAEVKAQGQVVNESFETTPQGVTTNSVTLNVPLAMAGGPLNAVRAAGKILSATQGEDPSIPDGAFAVAQFRVTITSGERIISPDDGVWAQMKKGLTTSMRAIGFSIQFLVIGLIVILPLSLIGLGVWKVAKKQKAAPTT